MTPKQALIGIGLLALGSAAAGLLLRPHLPVTMPTHWDASGHVNGWEPQEAAIALMVGLVLLPGMMLAAVRRFAPHKFTDEASWAIFGTIMFLLSGLYAYTWGLMLANALGVHLDVTRAITVPSFVVIALLANVLGKMRETADTDRGRFALKRLTARVLFAVSVTGALLVLVGVPALPCLLLLPLSSLGILGYSWATRHREA